MSDPTGFQADPTAWYEERHRAWAAAWEQIMRHAITLNDSAEQHQPTPLEETPWHDSPQTPAPEPGRSPTLQQFTSPDSSSSPPWRPWQT